MRIIRYESPRALAPRLAWQNPWAGLENEIDRMMNAAFTDFLPEVVPAAALSHPRIDLYEDKDNFHFRAELPGLKKEDIHIELTEGVLTLSGTRSSYAASGEATRTSQFSRSVSVPSRVQVDRITARYEDGVLTVTLPKAEEVKPRKIEIQVK